MSFHRRVRRIGIDPDFRIHVSDRLLEMHDRAFLEQGQVIQLLRQTEDYPARERLALRFEQFRKAE
jgi:putative restriction endonuclease